MLNRLATYTIPYQIKMLNTKKQIEGAIIVLLKLVALDIFFAVFPNTYFLKVF